MHNLFGNRFIGAREPAWHGLGEVFEDKPSAAEAISRARLDYRVEKRALSFQGADGAVTLDNRFALVRDKTDDDPEEAVFGLVSGGYEVIQNDEVARFVEPLVAVWPVETVGALGKGETIFFALDAGEVSIKGDLVHQFFLLTDTKDGTTGMRMAFTPVRVVCQNTLSTGLKSATVQMSISHVRNLGAQLEFSMAILTRAQSAQLEVVAVLQQLAEEKIPDLVARSVLSKIYHAPKMESSKYLGMVADDFQSWELQDPILRALNSTRDRIDYLQQRASAYQDGAWSLYERFNDEQPSVAETKWALYNAVVETEDYRNGSTSAPAGSVETSLLFGRRARTKAHAFSLITSAN